VHLYVFNDYGQDDIEKPVDLLAVEELTADFDLYPNPASEKLFIRSGKQVDEIALWDMQGRRLIYDTNLSGFNHTVDISALPQGIYTLVITSEGKQFFQKTIKR